MFLVTNALGSAHKAQEHECNGKYLFHVAAASLQEDPIGC